MTQASKTPPNVLSIAGSDPSGGAGVQADLKTFAAFGCYGMAAITALTAQNTRGVDAVHVPPVDFLRAQIDTCFADFDIRAVKLGMLANAEVVDAVADALLAHRPRHVVLDPVMIATSGARLLDIDAQTGLRTRLLPLASVLTPNIPEAEWLLGHAIPDARAADAALRELHALGADAVLLKGAHLDEGEQVIDRWFDGVTDSQFAHPRLALEGHGTGCTLASAIAAYLCLGHSPLEAARAASDYVARALASGYRPGYGAVHVLDHIGAASRRI